MSDPVNKGKSTREKISVPLRPLTKGIIRNVSPTSLPNGSFYDIVGYIPTTSGITRRSGMTRMDSVAELPISRYDYVDSFINDDGSKTTYAIADGRFYEMAGENFIERPCEYRSTDTLPDNPTISCVAGSANIVASSEAEFSREGILPGDILIVDPSGTAEEYTIDQVLTETSLFTQTISEAGFTDQAFTIKRLLFPAPEWQITVKRIDRVLYICTGSRPLMGYNVDEPERVKPLDVDRPFIPKVIEIFGSRLWCGNIYIPISMSAPTQSSWHTSRVSWSRTIPEVGYVPTVTGSVDIDPSMHFNDIVETGGEVSALAVLGSFLTVFFEYGIHYGRRTNIPGDTLPLGFDQINTGKRGVLQPGAVTVSRNGLFFVSTDGVYYLGENLKTSGVSDTVDDLLFRPEILNTRYKVVNMGDINLMIIGCGLNEDSYEEFWVLNLQTKAWTRFYYACAYFNVFTFGSRLVFDSFSEGQIFGVEPPGQNDDAIGNPLPDSPPIGTDVPVQPPEDLPQVLLTEYTESRVIFAGEDSIQGNDRFYATVGSEIVMMDASVKVDQNNSSIYTYIETGDFDFGRPDTNKTLYKIAMRLHNQAPVDLLFHVQGSTDSGQTWWDLCDLRIFEGGKEGKSNFQFTGSAPRLRLSSSSISSIYEIVEVTLDVKGRGYQFSDT